MKKDINLSIISGTVLTAETINTHYDEYMFVRLQSGLKLIIPNHIPGISYIESGKHLTFWGSLINREGEQFPIAERIEVM